MATLQTNPSLTPNLVQEWTRELNISELGRVGYLNISLTNWNETSTAKPAVIEGSIVEVNNSMYVETANVDLNTASQTVSSINWVIYEVSGSTATAYLKVTAPTASDYDVDKGGFYDGSGNRWTGQYMYVDGAGTAWSSKGILDYANGAMLKYRIDDEADDFVIDAKVSIKETLDVDCVVTLNDQIKWKYYYKDTTSPTENEVFDAIQSWVPNVGDGMSLSGQGVGGVVIGSTVRALHSLVRVGTDIVRILGETVTFSAQNGDATVFASSIEIMSNFDPIT